MNVGVFDVRVLQKKKLYTLETRDNIDFCVLSNSRLS